MTITHKIIWNNICGFRQYWRCYKFFVSYSFNSNISVEDKVDSASLEEGIINIKCDINLKSISYTYLSINKER